MRLTIKSVDFEVLGDPHRGRKFTTGMPLHRKGDREAMQRGDFRASLDRKGPLTVHVCVGDLFDKPKVANEVVAETADDYNAAIEANPGRWVCLTGNHDDSRDTAVVSSFQLFTRMVPGLEVISGEAVVRIYQPGGCKVGFIPWHPIKTAEEMITEELRDCDVVFGHWDVDRRQTGSDNYIPAARLVELGVKLAVTGHDHVSREMEIDGLKVIVTGSMQPYSHGEDPEGLIYETAPAQAVRDALHLDPTFFRDKVLRVVGEWDDEWPDCLQFTVVSEAEEAVAALEQVQIAEFNMADLWEKSFQGIDPEISAELRAKFAEIGGEDDV